MVIAIGALEAGLHREVRQDIAAIHDACRGALLKLISEACLLSAKEKRSACGFGVAAGAEFVKTSTGFSTGGATAHDVAPRAAIENAVGTSSGVARMAELADGETHSSTDAPY
jgi:deoxyribose-phosphate aldolase